MGGREVEKERERERGGEEVEELNREEGRTGG